jgi:hypothetical protein
MKNDYNIMMFKGNINVKENDEWFSALSMYFKANNLSDAKINVYNHENKHDHNQ